MTAYLAQANTGADALVTTRAVSKPGGVNAGDVGVFWLVRWSDAASFPAVTPPAGAVLRGTITNGTEQTLCYVHRVNAETTFTYSWTGGRWSALSALFFSGVDPVLDLSTAPFQSATGSGTSITTLTVTTVDAAALAWNVNSIATSGISHTPPTSFTEVADVSPWASAYRISPGSGSQSAADAANSPTAQWAAGLVALAPAAAGGVSGDAAVSGTATVTAAGVRAAAGSAALAATASLAASGLRATEGGAAVVTAATLTADGLRGAVGGATSAATAALAASGVRGAVAAAGLAGTANMTADGIVSSSAGGGAELAATAALVAGGQRSSTATAGLVASAVLAAGGVRGTQADAGLFTEAALAAQGQVAHDSGTALTVTATLTADGTTGTPPVLGDAALNATGTLTAAGERAAVAGAALNVAAVLAASGTAASTRTAALAATVTLTASGTTLSTGDDVDVTVGSPYSPWAVASPHAGDWEVGAPW
jgi:hypothetical protein